MEVQWKWIGHTCRRKSTDAVEGYWIGDPEKGAKMWEGN